MARIKGRSSGISADEQMFDAVLEEALHWKDVALYASQQGRSDVESMALKRIAQLDALMDGLNPMALAS